MLKKMAENILITDCAFTAACCSLLDCNVTAVPNAETGRREYKINGDINSAVKKIAANEPLGTLSLGQEIKRLTALPINTGTTEKKEKED